MRPGRGSAGVGFCRLGWRRTGDLLSGQLDPDGWVDAGEGRRQPNISNMPRGRGKLARDRCMTCSCRSRGRLVLMGRPACSAAAADRLR